MKVLAIGGLGLALAACAAAPGGNPAATGAASSAAASGGDTYFVREGMVHGINPPITAIWDMQVEVMDDEGNFDPALMDDATWAALVEAARQLDAESQRMAAAQSYAAADPNGTLPPPPEGTDLAAVQMRLDANPDAHRALARSMANQTSQLVAAAESRNAPEVTRLVNDAQPVCNACHNVFWYPEEAQGS